MHPVTREEIRKLDSILSNGLCHGGGNGTTTFCAEPACSAFGRRLNDSKGWGTDQDRARGMRPFLIADDWRPVALIDRIDLKPLVAPKREQFELFAG